MNGVSFLANEGNHEWSVGTELGLSLILHDEEVYSGVAKVARAERGPGNKTMVGLGLATGFLDLPDFRRRDDEKQLEKDLQDGPEGRFSKVPDNYRREVSKIARFLAFYRRSLNRHETRYQLSGQNGQGSSDLALRALSRTRDKWREMQVAASRAALEAFQSPEVLRATKEYTETLVTPLVLESPIGFRSYSKPRGYPGDFKVMQYYYNNQFEGKTAFGKLVHKFYVGDYPLGAGVRTRKDLMVSLMENEHKRIQANCGDKAVFRVVNLGCGPAREVFDFVGRNRGWRGEVTWTLVDQEEDALSVAYRENRSRIGEFGCNGKLNLLHLSFAQMISDGLPLRGAQSQDFIFASGLFDYIRESRAKVLIGSLYDLLAKDGLLAVGNAIAPNEIFWATEFLVDWTLLFRTKEEMKQLASQLPSSAEIDVVAEPSGAYYFLLIRKH
jgi:hypothetical protein